MDFFDNRYYWINKALLSVVGLWPFQRRATRRFTQAFGFFGCATIFFPQIFYVIKIKSDIDKLIASMPTFFGGITVTVKILALTHNSEELQLKALLNHIRCDWQSVTCDKEKWILQKHAATSRKFTICYSTLISIPTFFYLFWPIIQPILDIISPLNESRARDLPFPVELPDNDEKYFYIILLTEYIAYGALIPIVIGSDITYIACTQHACGMFAVLSHRLENSMPKILDHLDRPEIKPDKYLHDNLITCIRLHIKTILFVDLMAPIFSTIMLVDITLGLIMHCAACIMIVVRLNQPAQVALCGAVVCIQSVRLFFTCRPGQDLMDYSNRVANAAYNAMWYQMSVKTRRALVLMIMRSQMACTFVIAKIYMLNLNSFGVIMKTSMSYCTVMASVRDASYIVED